jgi:O-antigen/teichoic acid export membrane protein
VLERARRIRLQFGALLLRVRKALANRRLIAVGHLLTGTAATLVITFISVGLVARALGPASYGILALILTLGQACERLLSFQSWQPLIRYGATLDFDGDGKDLASLFKFGLLLDLGGSVIAWAIASLLTLASHWALNVSFANVALALIFMLSLLFNLNGVATAIFRLSDRYRTVARLQVVSALIRLGFVALAFWMDAGLLSFVVVWAITQALGSLINFAAAFWLVRRRGLPNLMTAPVRGINQRFPGLWRFSWGSNISLTLWSSAQQVDTLIVGWLADPASAGLFHIAKRVSRVVQQIGSQVEAVVYPDLSRLAAAGERTKFIRLLIQTEAILALFGASCFIAVLLAGEALMRLAAGPFFARAAPLLAVQILAVALTISGAASRAGLLALGKQPAVLRTIMASTLTFYCVAPPLVLTIGAMGANIAHLLFGAVWLSGLTLHLRRALAAGPRKALASDPILRPDAAR